MQKLPFLFVSWLAAAPCAWAQPADFNTIVQPLEFKAKDFSEYLVQLAWLNNPQSAVAQEEVRQAQSELKTTRKDWMKDLQVTLNLNEANLAPADALPKYLYNSDGDLIKDENGQKIPLSTQLFDNTGAAIPLRAAGGSAFYPRYNLGANINLGNILTQKDKNRTKQSDVKIAEHKVNLTKLELRAEVLTRYQGYKLAREIQKTRVQVESDAKDNFVLVGEQMKKDEKTFVDYIEASSAYHEATEARIRAESEVVVAKIKLEELIGLKWEQVQHPQKD